jgi:lysophospholipase L1-like esterase
VRHSRDGLDAAAPALVALISAAIALTCASERSVAPLPVTPPALAAPGPESAGPLPPPSSSPAAPVAVLRPELARPDPASGPERAKPGLALSGFRGALAALERGERATPVRVLWLGDSHTAADFMTGAVRSALTRRYAPGGPGFLRLGVGLYRHDQASVVRIGRFRVEPAPPSRRSRQGDGVFGFGGMRATPLERGATMSVKLARGALRGRARFSVLFDAPDGAAFDAVLGGTSVRVPAERRGRRVPDSPIARLELEGDEMDVLELRTTRGRPRFYGVIVEGTAPGVVLDTAGINGARLATALSWVEKPFVAEVAERNPNLFVLAYGTNEAFDGLDVRAYAGELARLATRIRRGVPAADCLVIGPPDALEPGAVPALRVSAIGAVFENTAREIGCAYVSGQALMGGPGAFLSWMHQDPPLARPDRVHLTPLGYRTLGARIVEELVDAEGVAAGPGVLGAATNSP